MVGVKTLFLSVLGFLAATAGAAAVPRASCVYTCGGACYWQSDIDAAVAKGYSLLQANKEAGDYPHQYRDDEGFSFPTPGTWYEYPILASYKVYTGGAPGADRVIFDGQGRFDSVITHTGASGDGFVACTA